MEIKEIQLESIDTSEPEFKTRPGEGQDLLDTGINVRGGSSGGGGGLPINTTVASGTSTTNIVFSSSPTYVELHATVPATGGVFSIGWTDGSTDYCHYMGQGSFATSFNNARCIDVADASNTFKATGSLSGNTLTLTWTSSSGGTLYLTAYPR